MRLENGSRKDPVISDFSCLKSILVPTLITRSFQSKLTSAPPVASDALICNSALRKMVPRAVQFRTGGLDADAGSVDCELRLAQFVEDFLSRVLGTKLNMRNFRKLLVIVRPRIKAT